MSKSATDWVAAKLSASEGPEVVGRTPENWLIVKSDQNSTFLVAVLGVQSVIELTDVEPLFSSASKPQLVVNVPSKAPWSGAAIDRIHSAAAAFGTLGDISRAASAENAGAYRDKNLGFFINAMKQHSNVSSVSYVYERVFLAKRKVGSSLIVAVVDAYNMGAEDVRNTMERFGRFDIAVKASSYGAVTQQAHAAARSMGAEALMFGELMQRLAK